MGLVIVVWCGVVWCGVMWIGRVESEARESKVKSSQAKSFACRRCSLHNAISAKREQSLNTGSLHPGVMLSRMLRVQCLEYKERLPMMTHMQPSNPFQ